METIKQKLRWIFGGAQLALGGAATIFDVSGTGCGLPLPGDFSQDLGALRADVEAIGKDFDAVIARESSVTTPKANV